MLGNNIMLRITFLLYAEEYVSVVNIMRISRLHKKAPIHNGATRSCNSETTLSNLGVRKCEILPISKLQQTARSRPPTDIENRLGGRFVGLQLSARYVH